MKLKLLTLALLAFTACADDQKSAIVGKWQAYEWTLDGKPTGMDASKVHFNFKEDGGYFGQFGDQKQVGTWRFAKGHIYAKSNGRPEMDLTILKADGVELEFETPLGNGSKEAFKFKRE